MVTTGRTALVTGSNAGIGREIVRQLASRNDFARIIMAARSPQRLTAAAVDIAASTGHTGLATQVMDVTDSASVQRAIAQIDVPIDVLIMNAGGIGTRPMELADSGVTRISALNVIGNIRLASGLADTGLLTGTALYAGTEGSRGVPILGLPKPQFGGSVANLVAVLDGTYYRDHKYSPTIAYGDSKFVGVLAMAAAARQYPNLRIVNVSPGATTGTNAGNDLSAVQRFVLGRIAPTLRLAHGIEVGAGRFLTVMEDPAFLSGHFYASPAGRLSGKLVDQATIFPQSADPAFQDNAFEAVARFTRRPAEQ